MKDEAEENAKLLEIYFKDLGYDELNVRTALLWAALLITYMYDAGFPIQSVKFAEVLRGVANLLDLRFNNKDKQ